MRIVTYNTRGSLGMDGVRDTRRIAETVRTLSPDVVCFQELHRSLAWSGREDQPARIGEALGRRLEYMANFRLGFGSQGIGIASRLPVQEVQRHPLPRGREPRGVLRVTFSNVPAIGRLHVLCTHWGLTETERDQQAAETALLVRSLRPPLIVCGDFNETPDRRAVQSLLRTWRSAGLRDAGIPGGLPTYPADVPVHRIDLFLYTPDLQVSSLEVIDALSSDHRPVVADFTRIAR